MYERWLLYFPPYRCSQCLNISKLTGDRTLGMRRLQKVANDIRQDTDTGVGQLTKDDDRGGVWRVAAFGAWRRLARAVVWLLRHTLLVIEGLYERWLLHFSSLSLFSMFEYLKSYW
jgi:hypothetical protein